jgi:hypothetical protein
MQPSDDRSHRLTRRETLVGGTCVLAGALAGCTRVSEFITDRFTGELNLFNTVDERLTGSLELVAPEGQTLLDEQLDLGPSSGGDEREPSAVYEGVLQTAGPHQLTVEVDATSEHPASRTPGTYEVTDPDDQKFVVLLGGTFTTEFIFVSVIEDFAELDDKVEGF